MGKFLIFTTLFMSAFAISGCTQKDRDTISDITYALTGVPGAKQKEQARQEKAKTTQEQIDKKADDILNFKRKREYWVGKSIDELVENWGTPSETYSRADGGRQVSYNRFFERKGDIMFGFYDYYCLTTFISNSKGIVKSWKSSGSCHYIKD